MFDEIHITGGDHEAVLSHNLPKPQGLSPSGY